jgi:hypothetical protein
MTEMKGNEQLRGFVTELGNPNSNVK